MFVKSECFSFDFLNSLPTLCKYILLLLEQLSAPTYCIQIWDGAGESIADPAGGGNPLNVQCCFIFLFFSNV